MSFLHRRSRSASASRPQTPASPSAHVAATQAFLASRASTSQANLSASAAATALRTMSPTPTPVDQVQTKRMVQRQASMGALTGAGRGQSRGGLRRQSSMGSMTERTFRTPSPSPSRQPSRSELAPAPAPPLPNIPQEYHDIPPLPVPKKKKKRASSQDSPNVRVASSTLPPPAVRGQSLDRYAPTDYANQSPRTNHLPALNELERTDSRNSVNFSRPLSPRPQSPVPSSPVATSKGQPSRQAVGAAISSAEAEQIQYDVAQTVQQPVKKKKKRAAPSAAEGSHLHSGTMASKPIVTPLAPGPEPDAPEAQEDAPRVRRKKKTTPLADPSPLLPASESSSRTDSDSDSNVERAKDRRAQRASGMLTKQPSIVREDWEGEQNEDAAFNDQDTPHESWASLSKRQISAANVSRKIEEPVVLSKPAATDFHALTTADGADAAASATLQVAEPHAVRGPSLSPSRSTRFSDRLSSDLALGRKHDPLPRSVSPAKSALKHHSPGGGESHVRGASVTPSESSDVSTPSADGLPKRKKSARVSFDSQPEIVGVAAAAQATESPGKERKGWLGVGKSKPPLATIDSNEDMEELMTPRPQLPSFGSVRGSKFRDADSSNATPPPRAPSDGRGSGPAPDSRAPVASATSSGSSSTSAPSAQTHPPPGVSSDQAVGAVLAQTAQRRAAEKQAPINEPLPPEVTSKECHGSLSDSESESIDERDGLAAPNATQVEDIKAAVPAQANHVGHVGPPAASPVELPAQPNVPIVSVSPPTPRTDQGASEDQWRVDVPGGFPVSQDPSPGDARADAVPTLGPGLVTTRDSDSDNDSIYSDAAEDPTELDGTGFGSIDAIVESPIVPSPMTRITTPPESPLPRAPGKRPQDGEQSDSWDAAQARWNDIAAKTRQAPAQPVSRETRIDGADSFTQRAAPPPLPQPVAPPLAQPKRKTKSPAAIAAAASGPVASRAAPAARGSQKGPRAAGPIKAPASSGTTAAAAAPFRHSMRVSPQPESESAFPKSMRTANRNSMPAPSTRPMQPSAAVPPPPQARAALQKKSLPPVLPVPPAAQAVANDSDSDSSFKRVRRPKAGAGGKYTMRRSMRGGVEPTASADGRSGVRSLSPVARRPFSQDSPHTMRTSMRGSVDAAPTLRGAPETTRSSSLFGRRQKSPSPAVPSGPKYRSRFVDSDDEDYAARPSKFHSRFADDSDDDEPVPLTPVRGIPRRGNDSESTDLEDSSDEDKRSKGVPLKVQIPASSAAVPGDEPLSPNTAKKRGFLGLFRSKKAKDDLVSPVAELPPQPAVVDQKTADRLGFASKAERDRAIEQARARLEAGRLAEEVASPPTHGKLQRKHPPPPQRVMSDSWPLPPKLPDSAEGRPSTADALPSRNGTTRLNQGSMRTKEPVEVVGRGGKKKRFPLLRKAFGLKD